MSCWLPHIARARFLQVAGSNDEHPSAIPFGEAFEARIKCCSTAVKEIMVCKGKLRQDSVTRARLTAQCVGA